MGCTEGSATKTYKEARSNSRSERKKDMTQKQSTLLQKIKELAAGEEDYEEIVSDLIPQYDSNNSDESRNHIITNSTVIPVLICQTGYNSLTILHSLEIFPGKRIGTIETNWFRLEKGNMKMTCCGSHSEPASSGGIR